MNEPAASNVMPYLVTGATGFVAMHLIELLLSRGHQVRGTLRRIERAQALTQALAAKGHPASRLEWVQADLDRDAGWREAARGTAGIFHVASPVPGKTPLEDAHFVEPARQGTCRVLEAAHAEGTARVVLTSSVAAITSGLPCRSAPFTESDWGDSPQSPPYEKSKIIAERAAWEFVEGRPGSPELVTINPSFVIGPLLWNEFSPSLDIVGLLLNSKYPGVPDLHFGLVDVRDVAEAHYLAMTSPEAAGKRFLCNTVVLSHREIACRLKELLGNRDVRIPTGALPSWVVKAAALLSPSMKFVVPRLGKRKELDSTRLRTTLGWQPRDINTTLKETAESLLDRQ